MWKLFDWFSNKAAQIDSNDQHKGLTHLNQVNNHKCSSITNSGCCAEDSDECGSLVSAEQAPQRQKPKARPDGESRRDGLAYWRMNTRREQPSDAIANSRLIQTGQWHAFPEPSRASTAGQWFDKTISNSLENLGSAVDNDTRANLNNSYLKKSQAALDMRRIGYGIDNCLTPPVSAESYPHYKGGWEPAHLDENGYVTTDDASQAEIKLNDVVASTGDETVYHHQLQPGSFSAETGPRAIDEPTLINQAEVPQDLVDSLRSVESSPQCDALFEQSAKTYEATQALLARQGINNYPPLKDSLAEQTITIDNMPSMQLSEIQIAVADHPETTSDVLLQLAQDSNPDVRFAIAENHNADVEILKLLSQDDNPFVAARARKTLRRLQNGQFTQGEFGGKEQVLRKAN
jgi:hypothetical protein